MAGWDPGSGLGRNQTKDSDFRANDLNDDVNRVNSRRKEREGNT